MTTDDEPLWCPVIPRRGTPAKDRAAYLRAVYEVGGRSALWSAVREVLVDYVGPRATCPDEVRALRRWVDLEQPRVFEECLSRFECAA